MARFRGKLPPINSNKHYVHRTAVLIASGVLQENVIAESVVAPATVNAFSVEEGSVIKAVFVELWVIGSSTDTTTGTVSASVEKRPSSAPVMTFAQSVNLGAYPNKKNILYVTQGNVAGAGNAPAIPFLRQWFSIPKGKQRMGLSDRIVLNVSSSGTSAIQICGIFTYKEYR